MTLLETLIAAAILLCGFLAVASMFTYSAGTNLGTQQSTTAAALLSEKMEELKFGVIVSNASDYPAVSGRTYRRTWQITGAQPRTITVVVFSHEAGRAGRAIELIRATTIVSGSFQ